MPSPIDAAKIWKAMRLATSQRYLRSNDAEFRQFLIQAIRTIGNATRSHWGRTVIFLPARCTSRRPQRTDRVDLFFAGEHTDTTGNWGTVHGAMESGLRAADQILGR